MPGAWLEPWQWDWSWLSFLNPMDPENFEIVIMLAASLWLLLSVLIECLAYLTDSDYGKDFVDPDAGEADGADSASGTTGHDVRPATEAEMTAKEDADKKVD